MPRKPLGPQPETPVEAQAHEQKLAKSIARAQRIYDKGAGKMVTVSTPAEEPVEARPGVYLAKITDQWLPLPEALVQQLGWHEGDTLELMPIMNGQVVIRKKDALKDQ